MRERLPLGSVAVISGAALANEVLLTRYFAIVHWHHYAYMMISLALLGFGASGTCILLAQRRLEGRFTQAYVANLAAFGVLAVGGPLAAAALPFQAEQLLWDPWQPVWLSVTYLVLALPFFCAGNALGLALLQWRTVSARVYAADLAGAGAGSLAILGLLYVVPPGTALKLVALAGPVAALVALAELGPRSRPAIVGCVTVLLALACVPASWLQPQPGPYKPLSQALRVAETRIVAEHSSPLARIDVIESPRVPLRHAPGLSLMATGEPPPQLGLFTDGEGTDAITATTDDPARLEFLGASTGALAYRVAEPRSVLVVGAGGGLEILRARHLGAPGVVAVERNPQIVDLLRRTFREYTGDLAGAPGVELAVGDARDVLASHPRSYELIVLPLTGAPGGSGLGGLGEDYLHTVEAFELYLARLAPGGFLSVTRHVEMPPRDALKLVATAAVALEHADVREPGRQLLIIRSWQAVTLLMKNGAVTTDEIRRVRAFCDALSFDVAWYPGMTRDLANVYNQLPQPWFYDGARALLGPERESYLAAYPFDLRPATDDRPYFHNHFRWRTFAEGWRARERGGLALLETGYPVLVATVLQALIAGGLLILGPLAVLRRRRSERRGTVRVFAYFAAIGLAFLFMEVAFMQKLLRVVYHPTVALAVALATFLLSAGAGSLWTSHRAPARARGALAIAVGGIVVLGFLYALYFDPLFTRIADWSIAARIGLAATLLAPLAFLMGMPFPLALRGLDPPLVPWAWGINGCASVVSPPLAILLAIDLGFTVVVCIALALYAVTLAVFPE